MKLSQKVYEYFLSIGAKPEDVQAYNSSSVYVAQAIAIYAHRNQKRLNGVPYVDHPFDVLEKYRALVGITPNDPFCLDSDLLAECRLPYEGCKKFVCCTTFWKTRKLRLRKLKNTSTKWGLNRILKRG